VGGVVVEVEVEAAGGAVAANVASAAGNVAQTPVCLFRLQTADRRTGEQEQDSVKSDSNTYVFM